MEKKVKIQYRVIIRLYEHESVKWVETFDEVEELVENLDELMYSSIEVMETVDFRPIRNRYYSCYRGWSNWVAFPL